MIEISKFLEEKKEAIHAELVCLVWLLVESIHYHPKNSRESAKTTLPALQWLLDGLYYLTFEELMFLYSLLVHTRRIKPTSSKDTRISALLSKLCVINSEHNFGTSQSRNFKSVEPFISTLSSGGYPKASLKQRDIPDWLRGSGSTDSSTSR